MSEENYEAALKLNATPEPAKDICGNCKQPYRGGSYCPHTPEPAKTVEEIMEASAWTHQNLNQATSDTEKDEIIEELRTEIISALTSHRSSILEEVVKVAEGMKLPEKKIEDCENCGEEGYGRAWYGRGRETGDAWGDRYVPTGSVVFCKACKPQ